MNLKMVTIQELIGIINDAVDKACNKAYGGDDKAAYEGGTFAKSTADLIAVTNTANDIKNWLLSNNPPSGYGLVALSHMLFELRAQLKEFHINFNYKEVFSLERSY
jgi:hypothetical protein